MLPSSVTLFYSGRCFSFTEDAEKALKGNLACDCTKSRLIREYCDRAFPTLRCGNQIAVVALESISALETEPLAIRE
jgi:hypothetical protein